MKNITTLFVLLLIISAIIFLSAGCSLIEPEEEEEFDRAALFAVDSYIKEMTNYLSDITLRADLKGWSRDYYEDESPPFYYDEERREWLREHKEEITALRQNHLEGSNFPTREEVFEWEIIVVRSEHEWMLYGEEVVEALDSLDRIYEEVIGVISMIIENEGDLDVQQSERVLNLIEDLDTAVDEVRGKFFRKDL